MIEFYLTFDFYYYHRNLFYIGIVIVIIFTARYDQCFGQLKVGLLSFIITIIMISFIIIVYCRLRSYHQILGSSQWCLY